MYGDALGYLREVGAQPEIARCLSGLGRVALDHGDTAAAREYLTESLRVCRNIGTRIGIARGLESFAALADREGTRSARCCSPPRRRAARRVRPSAAAGARPPATSPPPTASARGRAARLWEHGLACPPEAAIDLATSQALGARRAAPAGRRAGRSRPRRPSALTPRELEIAALIAAGRSNKAIAAELVISPATAARHVANIMTKLGFRSRAQIAAWATRPEA